MAAVPPGQNPRQDPERFTIGRPALCKDAEGGRRARMNVLILLGLILIVLLYIGRKLEVIAHLIYDGNKDLERKLEGILVHADYASTYLREIRELMESTSEKS